jgi:Fe-S cluster biogenesis protein NfuA
MPSAAQMVVEQFRRMVQPDGGSIELVTVEGGIMKIRYNPGKNEECESCVLNPEDLCELMKEAAERQDPSITRVELVA